MWMTAAGLCWTAFKFWTFDLTGGQVILLCQYKNCCLHCSQFFRYVVGLEECLSMEWFKKKVQSSVAIVITYENKGFFFFSSSNNTAKKHDIIKLECILYLLECLIFASEMWHSIMSNNFTGICLKHFYHMKLKDAHKEMVTISNMS